MDMGEVVSIAVLMAACVFLGVTVLMCVTGSLLVEDGYWLPVLAAGC